jgi:hypothetical protein
MRFAVEISISIFALSVSLGIDNAYASQAQDDNEPLVTWKEFQDRNTLFTVQYPSNWTPSGVVEPYGPIDMLFLSPGSNLESGAEVEFIQYSDPSVFRTAQEALGAEINSLQNDPTLTKFEIERPLECTRYTLNGLQACSVIYELTGPDGSFAALAVDSVATNGTEYEAYYKASFDSFEHFLPTVENMIESFQTTGSPPTGNDFSLNEETDTTNQVITSGKKAPPSIEDFSSSN